MNIFQKEDNCQDNLDTSLYTDQTVNKLDVIIAVTVGIVVVALAIGCMILFIK